MRMNCKLKCRRCGAIAITTGEDEEDINSFTVQDQYPIDWEEAVEGCDHEDFDVLDWWHDDYVRGLRGERSRVF